MHIGKKKRLAKEKITANYANKHDPKCIRALALIDLMADSNIPVGYWFMRIKDFAGSDKLKEVASEYINNITEKYNNGISICFAGNQGTGKTMSSICILKSALKNGFSAYYTTASDIMAEMTNFENSRETRAKLRETDFLVIDELDPRFFPSDAQKELFSSIYENIFRHRAHNMMPTIICTNETNEILNCFYGAGIQSIKSLNNEYLTVYPVVGVDYRKRINDGTIDR